MTEDELSQFPVETDPDKIAEATRRMGEIRFGQPPSTYAEAVRQIRALSRGAETSPTNLVHPPES